MHFINIIIAIAFASVPIGALPVDETTTEGQLLEAREATVTCKPKKNKSNVESFEVNMDYAKEQAIKAGFTKGKSGDPHNYSNGDKIKWGVKGCDAKDAQLWEYPIFWNTKKDGDDGIQEWKKEDQTSSQNKTPLRVVYIQDKGTHDKRPKVCGVMTHSEVDKGFQGKDFFQKCSS